MNRLVYRGTDKGWKDEELDRYKDKEMDGLVYRGTEMDSLLYRETKRWPDCCIDDKEMHRLVHKSTNKWIEEQR